MAGALALLSVTAHAQMTDASLDQIVNDDLRAQAQAAIESGNREMAIELLNELVRRDPREAGALLDVALLYCQLGERDLTRQTLARIEEQFAVPAPIQKLIVFYRDNPCVQNVRRPQAAASLGVGVTSNANFGPSSSLVTFASGAPIDSLVLAPSSLAHGDQYLESSLQGGMPIPGVRNSSVIAGFASRQYRRDHAYDQRVATLGVAHQTSLGHWQVGNEVIADVLWLGTRLYQRDIVWHASNWSPVVTLTGLIARAGIDLTVDDTVYPGNSMYNALRVEPRAALNARIGERTTLLFLIGPSWDHEHNGRPGGSRHGYSTYFELDYDMLRRGRLEAIYQQRTQTDASSYDPIFFGGEARQQTLRSASLRYVYPLSHAWSTYAQLSVQRVADSIPIFSYTVRSASVGLSWKY
ncbi:tetratricopeptide repeat protein [Paraburkholderia phymatum]|uniref:tetratricopeptide repeat protein n=1 Tax=Paraburkholderia phymatum TaxID=148447 RepID=UPI00316D82E5